MAWIESHQSLATHRKTKELSRLLKVDIPKTIGYLHLIWWWCLDNAPDGNLNQINHKDLSEAALFKKDPETLFQSLIASGFVDKETLTLHDWWDYAGKFMDKKYLTLEQKRAGGEARMNKLTPEQRSELGKKAVSQRWKYQQTIPAGDTSTPKSIPATVPNLTVPNLTIENHKEETSKEEKLLSSEPLVEKNVYVIYEEEIGKITPVARDFLVDAEEHYTEDWVRDAIKEAALRGKRDLKYIEGILKTWGREGRDFKPSDKHHTPEDYNGGTKLEEVIKKRPGIKTFSSMEEIQATLVKK